MWGSLTRLAGVQQNQALESCGLALESDPAKYLSLAFAPSPSPLDWTPHWTLGEVY